MGKCAYFILLKEFSTLSLGVEVEIKMTMQKEYELKFIQYDAKIYTTCLVFSVKLIGIEI